MVIWNHMPGTEIKLQAAQLIWINKTKSIALERCQHKPTLSTMQINLNQDPKHNMFNVIESLQQSRTQSNVISLQDPLRTTSGNTLKIS